MEDALAVYARPLKEDIPLRYICLMTDMRREVDERLTFVLKNPDAAWDLFGSVLEEKGDTSVIYAKI